MDVGLGDLAEDEDDLNDLAVHLRREVALACHDVQECRGQRIQKAFSDEHPAKVVLRRRTLQFEHAANAVECVPDQLGLFCVILVQ